MLAMTEKPEKALRQGLLQSVLDFVLVFVPDSSSVRPMSLRVGKWEIVDLDKSRDVFSTEQKNVK